MQTLFWNVSTCSTTHWDVLMLFRHSLHYMDVVHYINLFFKNIRNWLRAKLWQKYRGNCRWSDTVYSYYYFGNPLGLNYKLFSAANMLLISGRVLHDLDISCIKRSLKRHIYIELPGVLQRGTENVFFLDWTYSYNLSLVCLSRSPKQEHLYSWSSPGQSCRSHASEI